MKNTDNPASERAQLSRPARAGMFATGALLASKAVGVLSLPLFTRLLSPTQFGQWALYLTWYGIFFTVMTLHGSGAPVYRGLHRHRERSAAFLRAALGGQLMMWLIGTTVVFLCSGVLSSWTGLPVAWLLLLCVHVGADMCYTLYLTGERFFYRGNKGAVIGVGREIAAVVLGLLLVRYTSLGAQARVLAGAGTSLLLGIFAALNICVRGRGARMPGAGRGLLCSTLALLPHHLCARTVGECARVAVARMLGTAALSAFTLAHGAGMSLSVVTNGLNTALQPWILRKMATGQFGRITDTAQAALALLSGGSMLLTLCAPEAFRLLAPASYAAGVAAVAPISLAIIPLFLYGIVCGMEYYRSDFGNVLASVAAAALTVPVTVFLTRRFGVVGAAYSCTIGYIFLLVSHCASLHLSGEKVPINAKSCLLYYAFPVALCVVSPFLTGMPVLRYIASLCVLIGLFSAVRAGRGLFLEVRKKREPAATREAGGGRFAL